MYNITTILTELLNLVGWRQNYDTSDFTIADTLTTSDSGIYMQSVHPLLTLDNLKSIAPNFSSITYPEYAAGTTYRVGDRVKVTTNTDPVVVVKYRCIQAGKGKTPASYPDYWERFTEFSEWLENKMKDGILLAVQRLYSEKLIERSARNILENKALFDGAGRLVDTITNAGYFCGMEIIPLRAKGVKVKIHRIGTQFDGAGTIPLALYHTSQREPIATYDLTRTKTGSMEWHEQEIELKYIDSDTDAGGSYYIGYFQDDLPAGVKAIQKEKDWSKLPCTSCAPGEVAVWNTLSKFVEFHPFKVSGYAGELWDPSGNLYTYTSNYGLNFVISVECDLTDFIIEQKLKFAGLISKQIAVLLLREMAFNANAKVNLNKLNMSREAILYELDGDSTSNKKSGLGYALETELKALSISLEGLDRACQPCQPKGLKYRSV